MAGFVDVLLRGLILVLTSVVLGGVAWTRLVLRAEPDAKPTADDIATHLAEMSATSPFSIPASILDEVMEICARRGITG